MHNKRYTYTARDIHVPAPRHAPQGSRFRNFLNEESTSKDLAGEEGATYRDESNLLTSMDESTYEGGDMARDVDSDIDNLDFNNFKGIYFDEDPNRKYQDPETGCHFEYYDLCKRLAKLK